MTHLSPSPSLPLSTQSHVLWSTSHLVVASQLAIPKLEPGNKSTPGTLLLNPSLKKVNLAVVKDPVVIFETKLRIWGKHFDVVSFLFVRIQSVKVSSPSSEVSCNIRPQSLFSAIIVHSCTAIPLQVPLPVSSWFSLLVGYLPSPYNFAL